MKLLVWAALLVLLALPPLVKEKDGPRWIGPKLSGMTYREVLFPNAVDSIELGGLLFEPSTGGQYPVAIFIQGSGASKRDNSWYLALVEHLVGNGIAVLLPDKRGCEQSDGKWQGVPLEVLAHDTDAAITFVRASDMPFSSLGVVGISQGGWIAPIVGSQDSSLDFIVSVSASATTAEEQLRYEEFHNIEPYTYGFLAHIISKFTVKGILKSETFEPMRDFDPIPFWKEVNAPVFMAYGGQDRNCPSEESIRRLHENGLDRFQIELYPNGGHPIVEKETHRISTAFLEDLLQFIQASKGQSD